MNSTVEVLFLPPFRVQGVRRCIVRTNVLFELFDVMRGVEAGISGLSVCLQVDLGNATVPSRYMADTQRFLFSSFFAIGVVRTTEGGGEDK